MTSANNSPTHTSIWASETSLELPNTDIVSFALGKVDTYDTNKPIFVDAQDTSRFVTAAQVHDAVQRLCKGLGESGLKPGDCVTICSFNHILYPCLWLGVIGAGGVVAGVNPALTLLELKHHLTVTDTKYLIVHETCSRDIFQAATECGIGPGFLYIFNDDLLNYGKLVVGLCNNADSTEGTDSSTGVFYDALSETRSEINSNDGDAHGTRRLNRLLQCGRGKWRMFNQQDETATPALHATTSGTTGLPKAAVIPHRYLVSQSVLLEDQYASQDGEISQLICLPVFHTFAGNAAFVLPLRSGVVTYFLPRFRLSEFIDTVERHQITDTLVVPPIISSLVLQGKTLGNRLHPLRRLICAGAPMNPELQKKLYDYLSPGSRILQCWGTTETGWVTLTPVEELDHSGSVGRLTLNVKLKLVSADSNVLSGEGERGEALIKSTSMFLGYRNNPSANESAFDADGFYRTGDCVYSQNGKIFIEGRIKDVMKVNGWQVSPQELEERIQSHPSVADCAVVGYSTKDYAGLEQTHPRAYVVVKEGSRADADDICTWVSLRTVSYKHLTGGVIFLDSIPRNTSGKILRRLLVEGR